LLLNDQSGSVLGDSTVFSWVGCHSAIPGWVHVYTLCRVVRSIAIAASSVMDMSPDRFVLMFWDFYHAPIDECMVSRGCSRLEERGSIYLVDLIVTIEVRGEEALASTLVGSRLRRRDRG
jgi:hypothetical protein